MFHVLLEADEDALRDRVEADQVEAAAKPWRIEHLSKYADARPWVTKRADLVVNTTQMTPQQVADRIWDAVQDRGK